jgi:ketosteroid isomerase-like protein
LRKTFTVFIILSLTLPLLSEQDSAIEKEIRYIFEVQKDAWNEGDIEEFMDYYWHSDSLTFQSGSSRLTGWEALLSRYRQTYSGEDMGKLEFSDLIIHILSEDAAYALGRWRLEAQTWTRDGLFTTIFKRTEDGWKIVHDHTSQSHRSSEPNFNTEEADEIDHRSH